MNAMMPDRRSVLRGALAVAAVGGLPQSQAEAQQQPDVRFSAGIEPPKTRAPANASHCHSTSMTRAFPSRPMPR